jgi:hypothetical protein
VLVRSKFENEQKNHGHEIAYRRAFMEARASSIIINTFEARDPLLLVNIHYNYDWRLQPHELLSVGLSLNHYYFYGGSSIINHHYF